MLKLDFTLYSGQTLLHDWWNVVKSHFTSVQEAHNALEDEMNQSIQAEASERQSADTALRGEISAEASAREQADTALRSEISAEANARKEANREISELIDSKVGEVSRALSDESGTRASADAELSAKISEEITARQDSDRILRADINALSDNTHTHENFEVLNDISAADVDSWKEMKRCDTENARMIEYLSEVCRGFSAEFARLYQAADVVLYDGGIDGEAQTGEPLDGGSFGDTNLDDFDCGTFDASIFASAVLDGGTF